LFQQETEEVFQTDQDQNHEMEPTQEDKEESAPKVAAEMVLKENPKSDKPP
jgi:hypothetical protein